MEREVDSYLRRKYESSIRDIEVVHREDLELVYPPCFVCSCTCAPALPQKPEESVSNATSSCRACLGTSMLRRHTQASFG